MFLQFTVLSLECKKQCSPKRLNWFWLSYRVIATLTSVHDQTVSSISAQKGVKVGGLASQLKAFAAKPEYLGSVPGISMEEERTDQLSFDLHTQGMVHTQ